MYKLFIKRVLDVFFSISILIITSPILILTALLLWVVQQENPFFLQKRPGKNEKVFKIIKFKTMNNKKNEAGVLLSDEERMTQLGSWIRKLSVDELPQLFNVLKGDMSLVGPRPLLVSYLSLYNSEQKKRHHVKPGITGWAQINGRNNISWNEKFKYDVMYVEHLSFLLDLKIIFKTVQVVFLRKNIAKTGYQTSDFFNGNN